jgi:myb proto-oncogene protein
MEERHFGSVAAMVPGRTNRQCRERWVATLDPTNGTKKGKWTPEEDVKLTKAVERHGKHWGSVAVMVPGRTNRQCSERWVDTLDPTIGKKGKCTPEERRRIADRSGEETWHRILGHDWCDGSRSNA